MIAVIDEIDDCLRHRYISLNVKKHTIHIQNDDPCIAIAPIALPIALPISNIIDCFPNEAINFPSAFERKL